MDFSRIPHFNLLMSGFVALTILGIGIYVNRTPGGEQSLVARDVASSNTQYAGNSTSTDISVRDSDNDGLPDWEERLQGSDPFNADTDGDGTSDGKEVVSGRNPLKAGPDDKMPVLQDPNFATSSTDLVGIKKEFFAKYLATQSKDVRETTYRDLIAGFNPKKFKSTNELADLNITSDNDVDALRTYGNAFGKVIQKYIALTHRKEEDILADGLKTKSDATLKELQINIVTYKNFSDDLKAVKVPSVLAKEHLLIVNGYDGMSKGLTGMKVLFSNPIDGAAGYQRYTLARLDVTNGYAGVIVYLAKHNVTFTSDEPGYPLYVNTVTQKKGTTAI